MQTVVIVIHLMVIIALVAVVLLQKSEGGALGVGGSSQFMTTRGQGNVLTRATTILAAIFFTTSLAMSILTRLQAPPSAILDTVPAAQTNAPGAPPVAGGATPAPASGSGTGSGGGILEELNRFTQGAPTPSTTAPSTGAPVVPPAAQPANPAAPAGTTTPQVPTTQ